MPIYDKLLAPANERYSFSLFPVGVQITRGNIGQLSSNVREGFHHVIVENKLGSGQRLFLVEKQSQNKGLLQEQERGVLFRNFSFSPVQRERGHQLSELSHGSANASTSPAEAETQLGSAPELLSSTKEGRLEARAKLQGSGDAQNEVSIAILSSTARPKLSSGQSCGVRQSSDQVDWETGRDRSYNASKPLTVAEVMDLFFQAVPEAQRMHVDDTFYSGSFSNWPTSRVSKDSGELKTYEKIDGGSGRVIYLFRLTKLITAYVENPSAKRDQFNFDIPITQFHPEYASTFLLLDMFSGLQQALNDPRSIIGFEASAVSRIPSRDESHLKVSVGGYDDSGAVDVTGKLTPLQERSPVRQFLPPVDDDGSDQDSVDAAADNIQPTRGPLVQRSGLEVLKEISSSDVEDLEELHSKPVHSTVVNAEESREAYFKRYSFPLLTKDQRINVSTAASVILDYEGNTNHLRGNIDNDTPLFFVRKKDNAVVLENSSAASLGNAGAIEGWHGSFGRKRAFYTPFQLNFSAGIKCENDADIAILSTKSRPHVKSFAFDIMQGRSDSVMWDTSRGRVYNVEQPITQSELVNYLFNATDDALALRVHVRDFYSKCNNTTEFGYKNSLISRINENPSVLMPYDRVALVEPANHVLCLFRVAQLRTVQPVKGLEDAAVTVEDFPKAVTHAWLGNSLYILKNALANSSVIIGFDIDEVKSQDGNKGVVLVNEAKDGKEAGVAVKLVSYDGDLV